MADTFAVRFAQIRRGLDMLAAIPETGLDRTQSPETWDILERIEDAGRRRKVCEAPWLASLTQVDDLGPMGRALILSMAAIAALSGMPEEALAAGRILLQELAEDASIYRKI